ncbi:MAG: TM2 domain-containing protein [Bacteroidales bacterium]|nr:TM2 domain-containing protein [Bacteroidales bacterium]MDE6222491.1 TM2 domain-containing protein [Muribaculaceae bacterium]
MKYCSNCRTYHDDAPNYCPRCGGQLDYINQTPPPYNQGTRHYDDNNVFSPSGPEGKCRGVAALLAIFLGYFGAQYFYLGKGWAGVIVLLLSLCSCGLWQVISTIQGVLMLCMTNDEFERKYVQTSATFPLF